MATLNLWFFPIAVSAVHALFLAIVLWNRKGNRAANRLFSALLLSLALHLLDYSLNISGLILKVPHLVFTSYPLLFVMAPLFYLYVKRYLQQPLGTNWQLFAHFALAVVVLVCMLPFYLQSAQSKLDFLWWDHAHPFAAESIQSGNRLPGLAAAIATHLCHRICGTVTA